VFGIGIFSIKSLSMNDRNLLETFVWSRQELSDIIHLGVKEDTMKHEEVYAAFMFPGYKVPEEIYRGS
jgi:hypothetical protein